MFIISHYIDLHIVLEVSFILKCNIYDYNNISTFQYEVVQSHVPIY